MAEGLTTFRLFLLTFALGMGTFIQILDTSIANVSIPYIAGDLGVSPNEGTWVITSFAVSNAIVLPLTGWLAIRLTEMRLFILSTTLFSITSWLCGISWSLPALIFFRIIQGAAGGALIPLSQSLLLQHFPPEKKGMALGIWAMIVIVAPILGPIMGGWITETYGWRWIFYINIPIGFLSAGLTALTCQVKGTPRKVPVDIVGFIFLFVAVSSFQVLLDEGNKLDWFGSNEIIILGLASFISFAIFIPWNFYSDSPVVDFSFFRNTNFLFGTIVISVGYFLFFGSVVLLPLWLQTQQEYTSLWAGLAVAPIGIMPLFLSIIIGQIVYKMDPRWLVTASFLIFSYTFFWFSGYTTNISYYQLIIPRIIQGVGVALFFIPLVTISLTGISNDKLSSATGVSNFIRLIMGGGVGTSVFVTLWTRRETFHHSQLAEVATLANPETKSFLDTLAGFGVYGKKAYAILDNTVAHQAYMLSTNDIFWMAAWGFLIMIPFVWMCKYKPAEKHLIVHGE